jgi:hypothetical protein
LATLAYVFEEGEGEGVKETRPLLDKWAALGAQQQRRDLYAHKVRTMSESLNYVLHHRAAELKHDLDALISSI